MNAKPRIALIHATPVAIEPIKAALDAAWPEAEAMNILDDSLSPDRAVAAEIPPLLAERIVDLAHYARKSGADGILFSCSAFGSAIESAARMLDVPVLKPNEAMFEAAIEHGRNNAMIVTFAPARAGMEDEFAGQAVQLRSDAQLTSFVVEPAMAALRQGDADTHNRLVAAKARELVNFDAIVLAHFSTARAASAVRELVNIPVLSSPEAAVAKLRRLMRGT
ncbi:arylsulfatase [Bradyrhizobium centrolobii]|uniref:Arylsulfatase n=1 Tax=Bradyrhizobium centrolobii TaxID=1505087 RepID=A0A176YA63_9BRAD|nr:aspartate/glutamate racemase family protein [Bradyrhizobium centrolobii]OAE99044.1 arylsulfatase [Bradyrhizobium centrolobii]